MGFTDFAGSTVVHSLGGWASLVTIMVGRKNGKYISDGTTNAIQGHSLM
jgi:Amt family ammonium transporter